MSTFKDAKMGDKVWDFRYGWGYVFSINEYTYPLNVSFGMHHAAYLVDGYSSRFDKNPSLFWDEIKFEIPTTPLPNLIVDTKVLVWSHVLNGSTNTNIIKSKRYFSHFDKDGKIHTFVNGCTSWTTSTTINGWDDWELA